MRRSIRARLLGVFVVAVASFGVFAGAAGANGHGWNGYSSTNSYSSATGGTCFVAYDTTGGTRTRSATNTNDYGLPYYYCD